MVSGRACARGPAEPSSSGAAARAGSTSRHKPFTALTGRSRIGSVRRTGERRRFGGVVVVVAAGVPGPARVAVVAGRRVGTAVARNRAKRRLREALRRAAVPGGRDYIVIASAAVNEAPFEDVVAWIRRAVEE